MTLEQLLLWIIIGSVAGLLADSFVKDVKVGFFGTIVVGILGAFIGGWLFGLLNIRLGEGLLSDILTASIGAMVLLFLLRGLRRL